jgi:hypothetical protein
MIDRVCALRNSGNVSLPVPSPYGYDAEFALSGRDRPAWDHQPSGRMSLLDMINWSLFDFAKALQTLSIERDYAAHNYQADASSLLAEVDRKRLINQLNFITRECRKLNLGNAENRLSRIYTLIHTRREIPCGTIVNELQILEQSIEDDIQTEYFYHYQHARGILTFRIPDDWRATIAAFPSTRQEIEAAVDCYAMEHNAACVFHLMRVAEIGMRGLARERSVSFPKHPLEWAEWENIIDQIDSKAKAATAGMPRGLQRDAARAFYSDAVAQLRAFKETRNRIMHMRGSFDELDAQRSTNQVRDFMNGLSAKLGEKTRRPIRRWP